MKILRHPSRVEVLYWFLKKLTIMKLTVALILIFNLNALAKSYSQTTVTLHVKGTELKKVLGLIEKQSSYHFLFSDRKLNTDLRVDVSARNEDVFEVLSRMLSHSPYTFYALNHNLIVIAP